MLSWWADSPPNSLHFASYVHLIELFRTMQSFVRTLSGKWTFFRNTHTQVTWIQNMRIHVDSPSEKYIIRINMWFNLVFREKRIRYSQDGLFLSSTFSYDIHVHIFRYRIIHSNRTQAAEECGRVWTKKHEMCFSGVWRSREKIFCKKNWRVIVINLRANVECVCTAYQIAFSRHKSNLEFLRLDQSTSSSSNVDPPQPMDDDECMQSHSTRRSEEMTIGKR